MCTYASDWENASGEIISSYRAFSRDKIHARMEVNIGLAHANVTLRVIPQHNKYVISRLLDVLGQQVRNK